MPSLNTVKQYIENGYYHVYNRGVEKRTIFLDAQDYTVFLRFLKEYLLPLNHPDLVSLQGINPRRKAKNYSDQIKLFAYCLMPNHFHLFVRQQPLTGLKEFMKALSTNYVMYFNHKYKRVGPLFQSVYKANLIINILQFLNITRYIHRNPIPILTRDQPLQGYAYSSYQWYLSEQSPDWLHSKEMISLFPSIKKALPSNILSYRSFVEVDTSDENEIIDKLRLD